MATFPRFNGDAQPVFNLDVNNGAQTGVITAAATVQPQGPKLNFFKVLVKNGSAAAIDLTGELGTYTAGVFDPGVVQAINQTIQNTTTIAIYQVEADTTGQISYALYNNAAYDAAGLQTVLQAMGTVTITKSDGTTRTVDVSGTTVTDVGFKLA